MRLEDSGFRVQDLLSFPRLRGSATARDSAASLGSPGTRAAMAPVDRPAVISLLAYTIASLPHPQAGFQSKWTTGRAGR